jgi:hypothetical protein
MPNLPSFDELPVAEGKPAGSSWGMWGDDDVLGCLNLLTPERVQRGAGCVRKGAVFPLNYEMEFPDPPLFDWRTPLKHEVIWLENEVGHDDVLAGWNTQSSSQWDGFRHMKNPVHGFYNGIADEDHGVHHWARRGLAGRGVLADVARWRAAQGRPITPNAQDAIEPDDILATLTHQGVSVEPGDVLVVRTGWLTWYRALDEDGRKQAAESFATCGLRPGEATWRMLWDLHIAAIGADNPALEVYPPTATPEQIQALQADPANVDGIFMHFRLLPLLGLPIGEYWDLDALAADCASDGIYEFMFTSAPLNLRAGVASPPNALAIK